MLAELWISETSL